MRLLFNGGQKSAEAAVAQVSFSDSAGFGALAAFEARELPVFGPRGIAWRPCEGDRLLVLPVEGTDSCVGCYGAADLEPGELKLFSAGGARIHLKNNGDITLNGLTITKEGQVLPKSTL